MVLSDWLLTDKVASWPGTTAERGWRYLRQSLERYDTHGQDYKYSKAVFETLLLHNMQKTLPTWVLQRIQVYIYWLMTADPMSNLGNRITTLTTLFERIYNMGFMRNLWISCCSSFARYDDVGESL